MKTYAQTYISLLLTDSHPSPPPLSYLSLRFFSLLSLTDSLLSSPSSSPQEGEADGGSGKIRWAEDEDGDGGDGKQLGKGGHTCQGGE